MEAANNFNDFIDNPFSKIERVEINIRPTFLPLFFKPSETEKNKKIDNPYIIGRILKKIEVVNGSYLSDCLTGMKFELEGEYGLDFYMKGKFKAATKQFVQQIFDTYYDPLFETLKPTEISLNGFKIYDQFKGNPTKAAHFMVHQYYKNRKTNIVCKDVYEISIPGKNIQVDFTFEYQQQEYPFPMNRKHLYYFRIFKKYFKNGYNESHLHILDYNDLWDAKDVDIDFDYCMQIMKDACLKGKLQDSFNTVIYEVDGTGWAWGFMERENPKILELIFSCNTFINSEKINLTFDYDIESYVKLKKYPKFLADMVKEICAATKIN